MINNLSNSFRSSNSNKINFGAGWSTKIEKEVQKCNIEEISNNFSKQNIDTDFGNNKTIAWCSNQALKIFNHLNENYKMNLDLPKGIFVEDFSKIKEHDNNHFAICNWYPAYLKEGSNKVYKEKTLIFNSARSNEWDNIDAVSKELHKKGELSGNHFLNIFLHEFGHGAHNGNFIKKFEPKKVLEKVREMKSIEYSMQFMQKFGDILSSISKKAQWEPLEALADDMALKIESTLSIDDILPTRNPFRDSLYPKNRFAVGAIDKKEVILRSIWNGKEIIQN